MLFIKNKNIVAKIEDNLIKILIKTPVVKLKPIKLINVPDISSEIPIFFGVIGKKSTKLLTKKIVNITLKLKSSCKKLITE